MKPLSRDTAYVLWLFFGPPALFVLWWLIDPNPKNPSTVTAVMLGLYFLPVAGRELGRAR